MRSALTIVHAAALTLWLGGLVALFIFVQVLFKTDRAVAANAAPILFRTFEVYQLGLLVIALLSLLAWRMLACSRWKKWMTVLVVLAGAMAVAETAFVSSRMRTLMAGGPEATAAGTDAGAEFRRLHGYSMMLYSGETILLAIAACLLPSAIRAEADGPAVRRPTTSDGSPQTSLRTQQA